MAQYYHLARPYAKAAFMHAKESQLLDQWQNLLESVNAYIADETVHSLLDNPSVSQSQVVDLLIDTLKIKDKVLTNLLILMAKKRRLDCIDALCDLFKQYKTEEEKTLFAKMTSAFEVDQKTVDRIKAKLTEKFQSKVIIETEIDPSLIGGCVIHIGDLVIDGSVVENLRRLKQELIA